MNKIIRSKAPCRISFGGGGSDVSPYCEENGGCVVNVTINRYAWSTLEFRDDKKISIKSVDYSKTLMYDSPKLMEFDGDLDLIKAVIKHFLPLDKGINVITRSQIPPRSGLGSSASAFVSVIGLFNHLKAETGFTDYNMAELAYHLERNILKNEGGRQDQYCSTFGGLNFMEFKGNDFVRVSPLRIKQDILLELEKNLLLVYIGSRNPSGDIIKDQINKYTSRDKTVVDALNTTKQLALEMKKNLLKGDLNIFGELLHQSWLEKKKFSNMVSTPLINKMYDIARNHGAIGGKVTGGGGGGHMIFYCKPNTEHIVGHKLKEAGAKVVDFSFDFKGLQTWEVHNE